MQNCSCKTWVCFGAPITLIAAIHLFATRPVGKGGADFYFLSGRLQGESLETRLHFQYCLHTISPSSYHSTCCSANHSIGFCCWNSISAGLANALYGQPKLDALLYKPCSNSYYGSTSVPKWPRAQKQSLISWRTMPLDPLSIECIYIYVRHSCKPPSENPGYRTCN